MSSFLITLTDGERFAVTAESKAAARAIAESFGCVGIKSVGVKRATGEDRRYLIEHGALCAIVGGREVWAIGDHVLGSAKNTAEVARRLREDSNMRDVAFLGKNGCVYIDGKGWYLNAQKFMGREVAEAADTLFFFID